MITSQIDTDLKVAMLGGDKTSVSTLRGLKSALQYAAVAKNSDLTESEIISVLQKEAKKRTEAAELYKKSGDTERTSQELSERVIIEKYLPAQASEEEINQTIDKVASELGEINRANMGQAIGQAKAKLGPAADGSVIARLIQSRL